MGRPEAIASKIPGVSVGMPKERPESTRKVDQQSSMGSLWYKREMKKLVIEGYPLMQHYLGAKVAEAQDMNVEFDGTNMDMIVFSRKVEKAFQAGFGSGLKAETMGRILREKMKDEPVEDMGQALEFAADLVDLMPKVGQERKSKIKAMILTGDLPL